MSINEKYREAFDTLHAAMKKISNYCALEHPDGHTFKKWTREELGSIADAALEAVEGVFIDENATG